MRLVFFFMIFIVCASLSNAAGLGVSPSLLTLEEGIGRLVLFNPGSAPLSFEVESEGVLSRPAFGRIAPLSSTSVIVTGENAGTVLVMASGDIGPLPSVEVPIIYKKAQSGSGPDILLIIACVAGMLILSTCLIWVLLYIRGLRMKPPQRAVNGEVKIHEEKLSE